MRPDLGHIEDIPLIRLCVLGVHDLHIDVPGRIVAFLDGIEQVLDQAIGVFARNLHGFLSGHVLHAQLRFDVDFDVFEGAILSRVS